MTKEKKWIRVHRWFWGIACLICIVVSLTAGIIGGKVAIVKDSAYAEGITCKIEVEFDKEVDQGFLYVAFYDAAGNLLDIQKSNLSVYGKTGSAIFFVNDADTYEILTCRILPSGMILRIWLSVLFSIVFLTGWVSALLLCCKEYEFERYKIVVYSGFYHHYITVDGKTGDEHNTIISFTPITLSCQIDENTALFAVISLMNRISLKINGMLCRPKKEAKKNLNQNSRLKDGCFFFKG